MIVTALSLSRVFLSTLASLTICWIAEIDSGDQADHNVKLEQASNDSFYFKFNRDKAVVASGGDEIKVWDTKTGKLRMCARNGITHGPDIAFSSDGKLVAYASLRSGISVWNTETGKQIHAFDSGNAKRLILAIQFSPDGKVVATGNNDDTISLWNISTGSEAVLRQEMSYGAAIDFSEDGKQLASGGRDGTVRIWDVARKTETVRIKGFQGRVNEVVFGGGDRFLLSLDIDRNGRNAEPSGAFILNRVQDGKEIARFPNAYSPTLSGDARYLCALSEDGRSLSIWNTGNQTRVFQHQAKGRVRFRAVEFLSDDKLICLMGDGEELSVSQMNTGLGQK